MFENRTDAGRQLAELLDERGVDADVVLAIPRGGLPVGRAVADRLGIPLDVVVASKVGTPWNPELAIGAVASDGTVWLNDELIDDLELGDATVERLVDDEHEKAEAKRDLYREDRPPLDLTGKEVLIVDDGVATGATVTACLRSVRNAGAARVLLAVPVGPPGPVERLREEADAVIVVEVPQQFGAVGQFYHSFAQVSDEEARTYLEPNGRDENE
ncbi:MAG: putative phosphoribosyl transferase [Halobacteriales archaeon]|jgi:putative phosphoribosyl transferase